MGTFSIWHWVIVGVVILLLFGGRGKLSGLMGDAAKGINAFKKGLRETDADKPSAEPAKSIDAESAATAETAKNDEVAKG